VHPETLENILSFFIHDALPHLFYSHKREKETLFCDVLKLFNQALRERGQEVGQPCLPSEPRQQAKCLSLIERQALLLPSTIANSIRPGFTLSLANTMKGELLWQQHGNSVATGNCMATTNRKQYQWQTVSTSPSPSWNKLALLLEMQKNVNPDMVQSLRRP
jgi:hypothetical protein